MEIERKYLVKTLPEHLEQYQSKKSHRDTCVRHRWYVSAAPTMIIISPIKEGLMVREEYNLPLTKEAYEHLLLKIDGLLIAKTRYLIPLNDHLTAELDIFEKISLRFLS